MRFAFYLEDSGQQFSLRALRDGQLAVGGQTARLRILFWLVKKGHTAVILNHYDEDTIDGVNAIRIGSLYDIPGAIERFDGVDLFVFNNQAQATELAHMRIHGAKAKAMWAGNPFPTHWVYWLNNSFLSRIVCVSHNHREAYRPYPNFHRIEVSYSGIDYDLLDKVPCGEQVRDLVVFLGAPRITKGFHNLLEAWPYVLKEKPSARLRVLGSTALHDTNAEVGWTGILDRDIETEYLNPLVCTDRNIEKLGIEFAGLLPIKEVFRELKQASIAVVNCNWDGSVETYCRSALEAQACGIPVVGAARGSLPEVVRHNETGLLVEKPDPRELASVIIKLLDEDGLRRRLGDAARQWARSTANYETLANDWVEIAERAVKDEPAPVSRSIKGDMLRLLGYGRARIFASRLLHGTR